jgi:erythromycin esterase
LTPFCKSDNSSKSAKTTAGSNQKTNSQSTDYVATKKELAWLKNNCIKIQTVQAENGFNDLQPLKQMIGNAKIIGLGEFTHGTSEVFKMKHRLIEFLASEMGFTIFSIEQDMPEAYKLNDYVLYGKGDPKLLISSWGFYLNNQEVLDMIEWMRKFNLSGKGKIQFTGFDMQRIQGALENLTKFAEKNDRILKSKIDTISTVLEKLKSNGEKIVDYKSTLENIKNRCGNLVTYLTSNKKMFDNALIDPDYKWLVQNATILVQSIDAAIKYPDLSYRDRHMAENVEWILNNNPNEKIVLWAHSGHIMKNDHFLGGCLSEKYGKDYYNIGFSSNSGTFTAVNTNFITSPNNTLNISKPGSFEYNFHKVGIQIFYLDFNKVSNSEKNSLWLKKSMDFRGIGSNVTDMQFFPTPLTELFNAIIYIDSTHSSNFFKPQ